MAKLPLSVMKPNCQRSLSIRKNFQKESEGWDRHNFDIFAFESKVATSFTTELGRQFSRKLVV